MSSATAIQSSSTNRRFSSQRSCFLLGAITGVVLGFSITFNLSFVSKVTSGYHTTDYLSDLKQDAHHWNMIPESDTTESSSNENTIEFKKRLRKQKTMEEDPPTRLPTNPPTSIPIIDTSKEEEPPSPQKPTPRYYELPTYQMPPRAPPMTTAFIDASIVLKSSWFQPKRICKGKCCAETVAISLDQDDTRIKNTIDGLDLADVLVRGHELPDHLDFHAATVSPDIIPCFQPGTIVHIDNYGNPMRRWFEQYRLQVTVPYLLITSETDGHSPIEFFKEKLSNDVNKMDKLLIKWYGMNPDTNNVDQLDKFVSFPLGLSKYHEQMPYLTHYLRQTKFANPFAGQANKDRWIQSLELQNAVETTNILFVKFGINPNSQHRKVPLAMACDHLTNHVNVTVPKTAVSCTRDHFSMSETYAAASQYLFGLSPPGNGMDCYRTYELWMLGVIPIIQREKDYDVMFKDLPIIQLTGWEYTQQQLIEIMRNYVASDEFRNNDFAGWERLFLRYWRRKVLADTGRDKDILQDENGREYYQAWRYSLYERPLVQN